MSANMVYILSIAPRLHDQRLASAHRDHNVLPDATLHSSNLQTASAKLQTTPFKYTKSTSSNHDQALPGPCLVQPATSKSSIADKSGHHQVEHSGNTSSAQANRPSKQSISKTRPVNAPVVPVTKSVGATADVAKQQLVQQQQQKPQWKLSFKPGTSNVGVPDRAKQPSRVKRPLKVESTTAAAAAAATVSNLPALHLAGIASRPDVAAVKLENTSKHGKQVKKAAKEAVAPVVPLNGTLAAAAAASGKKAAATSNTVFITSIAAAKTCLPSTSSSQQATLPTTTTSESQRKHKKQQYGSTPGYSAAANVRGISRRSQQSSSTSRFATSSAPAASVTCKIDAGVRKRSSSSSSSNKPCGSNKQQSFELTQAKAEAAVALVLAADAATAAMCYRNATTAAAVGMQCAAPSTAATVAMSSAAQDLSNCHPLNLHCALMGSGLSAADHGEAVMTDHHDDDVMIDSVVEDYNSAAAAELQSFKLYKNTCFSGAAAAAAADQCDMDCDLFDLLDGDDQDVDVVAAELASFVEPLTAAFAATSAAVAAAFVPTRDEAAAAATVTADLLSWSPQGLLPLEQLISAPSDELAAAEQQQRCAAPLCTEQYTMQQQWQQAAAQPAAAAAPAAAACDVPASLARRRLVHAKRRPKQTSAAAMDLLSFESENNISTAAAAAAAAWVEVPGCDNPAAAPAVLPAVPAGEGLGDHSGYNIKEPAGDNSIVPVQQEKKVTIKKIKPPGSSNTSSSSSSMQQGSKDAIHADSSSGSGACRTEHLTDETAADAAMMAAEHVNIATAATAATVGVKRKCHGNSFALVEGQQQGEQDVTAWAALEGNSGTITGSAHTCEATAAAAAAAAAAEVEGACKRFRIRIKTASQQQPQSAAAAAGPVPPPAPAAAAPAGSEIPVRKINIKKKPASQQQPQSAAAAAEAVSPPAEQAPLAAGNKKPVTKIKLKLQSAIQLQAPSAAAAAAAAGSTPSPAMPPPPPSPRRAPAALFQPAAAGGEPLGAVNVDEAFCQKCSLLSQLVDRPDTLMYIPCSKCKIWMKFS